MVISKNIHVICVNEVLCLHFSSYHVPILLPLHCCCVCVLLYVFACRHALICPACLSTGKCVWGLDYSVLLLPSGCMSDDKRNEVEDENSDISCVYYTRMLLKKQQMRSFFFSFFQFIINVWRAAEITGMNNRRNHYSEIWTCPWGLLE